MITVEEFTQKTGRPPKQDDLERVNCPDAGKIGHWKCGWCPDCDKPRFACEHFDAGAAKKS